MKTKLSPAQQKILERINGGDAVAISFTNECFKVTGVIWLSDHSEVNEDDMRVLCRESLVTGTAGGVAFGTVKATWFIYTTKQKGEHDGPK